MKSTFSRQVSTTVLILLLALLLLGGAFRVLVGRYLEQNTHAQLQTDALALAELVAAYDAAGDLQQGRVGDFQQNVPAGGPCVGINFQNLHRIFLHSATGNGGTDGGVAGVDKRPQADKISFRPACKFQQQY